jgi:DNA-binding transcriptional LysR family regulator
MMDLRQLRSFVAVAEELSFRRAAERLHLSQPPLSRQIQALEEELGVRLLVRDRRKQVTLTDAGHTFLADARSTLAIADGAAEHAREAARGLRGRLTIANIATLSTRVLPRLLREFRQHFPDVEVSVVEMTRGEQLAALREGKIHLGIYPDLGALLDCRFGSQPLFSCPMVVVLPADHDLAQDVTTEIEVKALVGMTLVTPSLEDSPGYFERLNQLCAFAHFTPAALCPVNGLGNVLGMVAAGYGVTIMPEVVVSGPGPAWRIRRLCAPVPTMELKLVWLRASSSLILQNFLSVARGCIDCVPDFSSTA